MGEGFSPQAAKLAEGFSPQEKFEAFLVRAFLHRVILGRAFLLDPFIIICFFSCNSVFGFV